MKPNKINEEEKQKLDSANGDKGNAFPITCPACGKTHEWKVEAPENPFLYVCPDCGSQQAFLLSQKEAWSTA